MASHEEYDKDIYSFAEYCADFDILPLNSPLRLYPGAWDAHGDAYIEHCLTHDFFYERIE